MSNVIPLLRVTGTAHGVRRVEIPAKDAVYDRDEYGAEVEKWPAREASHYYEAGIATVGRFGENVIRNNNPATLPVLIPDELVDDFPAGAEVDIFVSTYSRFVPGARGRKGYNQVAFRFAGLVAESVEAVEEPTPLAAAGGRRR